MLEVHGMVKAKNPARFAELFPFDAYKKLVGDTSDEDDDAPPPPAERICFGPPPPPSPAPSS